MSRPIPLITTTTLIATAAHGWMGVATTIILTDRSSGTGVAS
jgi:hypothetical protein